MQRGNPNSPPPRIKSMLVVVLMMASMVAGRSATVERDVGSDTQVKCTCYPCGCAQSPPPPPAATAEVASAILSTSTIGAVSLHSRRARQSVPV
ncbi:unnamed protein product [Musa textilis]